ncbi:amino acid ABC transporter ATP-binding protein [Aquabacter sp. CN5-332]|uniref:amino acid ABC transporter ATP-binding protein n=1 Tax=Aquabacter sp. CN5-332 TaxID=3156608 RepID=UPI0032B53D2E
MNNALYSFSEMGSLDMDRPILMVRNLTKSFSNVPVLKGISLDLQKGAVLGVIGGSGSGKSTFLRCLNYIERPTSGEVYLEGQPIGFQTGPSGLHVPDTASSINRMRAQFGMVFQQYNLWPHMTVLQNVIEAPLHVKRLPRKQAVEIARAHLAKVNMLGKENEYPARLSGGQQQRVAIARALAMTPKIMLFDEATSALDPELTGEVLTVMRSLAAEGATMIIVTHEMAFVRDVADRILFFHDGRIEDDAPAAQMFATPNSERCRQFLARALQ